MKKSDGRISCKGALDLGMYEVVGGHKGAAGLLRTSADVSTSSQLEILSKINSQETEVVLPCKVVCFIARRGGLDWFRSKGSYRHEAQQVISERGCALRV